MNKYKNREIITPDGAVFDSKREAMRYLDLKLLEKYGGIRDLKRQVPFVLIPAQREESHDVFKRGPKKGQKKPGKVIEQAVVYCADFTYTDCATGEKVVEDAKGVRTKDYIIKRKLMLYVHKIRIKET